MSIFRGCVFAAALVLVLGQMPGERWGGGACTTNWNCSLGGTCTDGVCVCDAWFTGPTCALLNLQPPRFDDQGGTCGSGFASYYSWGGHAIENAAGDGFDMYASFMCRHATLDQWTTKSASAHFVAAEVDAPYTWGEEQCDAGTGVCTPIIIPWSHNTVVSQNAPGLAPSLLIYHVGDGVCNASEWAPCFNASEVGTQFAAPARPERQHLSAAELDELDYRSWRLLRRGAEGAGVADPNPGNTAYVATADSPTGPWTRALNNSGVSIDFAGSWTSALAGNPAALIFPDGSVNLYFTAVPCPPNSGALAANCIAVATADAWDGPYSMNAAPHPITYPESEDPFVFVDPRGNYHLLTNVNTCHARCAQGVPCGGHAWSTDGRQFSNLTVGAFGPVITFANGTEWRNAYVERPLVTLAPDGHTPLAFHVGMGRSSYSDSCNWVQLFCTNGSDPACGPTTPTPPPPPPPPVLVKLANAGSCVTILNATAFPCSGSGPSAGCPLVMGPCSDPSAVWSMLNTSGGFFLQSESVSLPGGGVVSINVDCDDPAPHSIVKALASGENVFTFSAEAGTLGVVGACINTGQGPPNPPCGKSTEIFVQNQIQMAPCTDPTAAGWTLISA